MKIIYKHIDNYSEDLFFIMKEYFYKVNFDIRVKFNNFGEFSEIFNIIRNELNF